MNIEVIVPAPLRKYTGNQKRLFASAKDVAELLDWMADANKPLSTRIVDDVGVVREFIRIFVNKKDIRHEKGLQTILRDGDVVSIIPAFAGG